MSENFSALLAQWTNFYLMAATGAATFTGLLFVAISINVDVISREEKRALRTGTMLIFIVFLTVFFVALLLLLPGHSALSAGWVVAGSGVLALLVPASELYRRLRTQAPTAWPAQILVPLLVLVILNLILIRQGFAIGAGDQAALSFLPMLLAVMLLVALLLSWRLLIDLARIKPRFDAQDRNAERDRGTERQIRNLVRELRAQNRRQRESESSMSPPPRDRERTPRR